MRTSRRLGARLHRSEEAQNAFEYLLLIGGLLVAIAGGLLGINAVVAQVVGLVCPSVDTANALSAIGNCVGT
jgi:hypothetical protein